MTDEQDRAAPGEDVDPPVALVADKLVGEP
jgi:hypothetical protein